MNYKEHCISLEAEIVGYRCTLEAIKMGAAAQRNGPLYRLCEKTLTEPGGLAVTTEVSLIRVLEMIVRELGQHSFNYQTLATRWSDVESAEREVIEETMRGVETQMTALEKRMSECLVSLDAHREKEQARQKLAYGPKLIIPGVSH